MNQKKRYHHEMGSLSLTFKSRSEDTKIGTFIETLISLEGGEILYKYYVVNYLTFNISGLSFLRALLPDIGDILLN